MNIAIITGASSGMGREFVTSLPRHRQYDEVWIIARGQQQLEQLQQEVNFKTRVIAMDLTNMSHINVFKEMLEWEKPEIKLLINASGYGKFESSVNVGLEASNNMIDLNVKALVDMTLMCLPYMTKGSEIIEIASVAAFQPVPYINVYAATKAFVLSFTRGLKSELESEGIHAMALCPYWTATKFFDRAKVSENTIVKKYVVMYKPEDVIEKAWMDLDKKKEVSIYGAIANGQVKLCKFLPHSVVMKVWKTQQGLK